jgi:ribosome-associated protein
MSSEYIKQEINKIMTDDSLEFPLNIAMATAWIMGNFKGINLKVLNTQKTSSISDYFVLASATNQTQAKAMAEIISKELAAYDFEAISKEGMSVTSDWILLDFGDIICHIFLETSRDVYNLEALWKDAEAVEIPQSYYFSSEDAADKGASDDSAGRSFF